MRIIVFGAAGKVGSELVTVLTEDGHEVTQHVRNRSLNDLHDLRRAGDLTCLQSNHDAPFWKSLSNRDIIINASAFNGMEANENDPEKAFLTNTVTPTTLANFAKRIGALFIHYSTDYIFSGHPGGLTENEHPNPTSIYGWSKWMGEKAVEAVGGDHIIMRLSSIYGCTPSGPTEVLAQVRRGRGSDADPVQVLKQFCAPTSARLVADATAHIIRNVARGDWPEVSGIYHFASREGVWKRDFAKHIIKELLDTDASIVEGTLTLSRPIFTFLRSDKFSRTFDYTIPTWEEDFSECIKLLTMF